MRSSRRKTAYLVELAVKEIARKHACPILCTLTFEENLTSKDEARKRWKRLRERVVRRWPQAVAVGVWQRQARGAWHLHLVVSHPLAVVELREMAVACGWGFQMRLDVIGSRDGFRAGKSVQQVVRYVTRYIVRDIGEEDDGECLTVWVASKPGSVAFHWNGQLGRLRRLGLAFLRDMEPDHRKAITSAPIWWRDVPFEVLVRLGWETLPEEERIFLVATSDAVARWWNGPAGEGNALEPF